MTDQDDRPGACVERPFGRRHVIGERGQRVLDCNDLESFGLEQRDDLLPARTIGKRAVNQHDCLLRFPRRSGREGNHHRYEKKLEHLVPPSIQPW
jgi:hypothetical protein